MSKSIKFILIIFAICFMFFTLRGSTGQLVLKSDNIPEFLGIGSGYLDDNGHSYFYSHRHSRIFHFDQEGNPGRYFCQKGRGPGEIVRVLKMYFDPYQRLLYLPEFYSQSKGKVTIYDTKGNYKGLLKPDISRSHMDKISGIYPLKNGNYYLIVDERVGWEPHGKFFLTKEEISVRMFNPQGKLISNIYKQLYHSELSHKKGWGGPAIPFSPSIICKITPEENLAIARNDNNSISFYNQEGKIKPITLNLKREELSNQEFKTYQKALIDSYKKYGQTPRMIYLAENMIKLKFKPLYGSFFITDNFILLTKIIKRGQDGYPLQSSIQILNRNGSPVKILEVKGRVINISQEKLITKHYGEEDEEKVVISPIADIILK